MWLKSVILWIDDKWCRFEDWVASLWPGIKTKIVTAAGAIASAAALGQQYLAGLPTSEYINLKTLSIVSLVLFTLAFWLRGIGERAQAREVAAPVS